MSKKRKTKINKIDEESIFVPNPYKVIYFEDDEKTLRKTSEEIPVDQIQTDKMQLFFDQLYDAMIAEDLPDGWMHAGVSAIQVGEPIRAFFAYNGNYDYYELFINPEVELLGTSTWDREESCLSVPDVTGKVRRHKRVRVKYFDRDGQKQKIKCTGWNARVIQHEMDHLNGVLFIDKLIEE